MRTERLSFLFEKVEEAFRGFAVATTYLLRSCTDPSFDGQEARFMLQSNGDTHWTMTVNLMDGSVYWEGSFIASDSDTDLPNALGTYSRTDGSEFPTHWAIDLDCPDPSSVITLSSPSSNNSDSSWSSASSPSSPSSLSSLSSQTHPVLASESTEDGGETYATGVPLTNADFPRTVILNGPFTMSDGFGGSNNGFVKAYKVVLSGNHTITVSACNSVNTSAYVLFTTSTFQNGGSQTLCTSDPSPHSQTVVATITGSATYYLGVYCKQHTNGGAIDPAQPLHIELNMSIT